MDCPHCGTAFHDEWISHEIREVDPERHDEPRYRWLVHNTLCPACWKTVITIQRHEYIVTRWHPDGPILVHPMSTFRKPTPPEVPQEIKEDYEEACRVLPFSHKASAALSRRCLQAILRRRGYVQHDLAKQIDALLNEQDTTKAIPTSLRETVDAVRSFGNFSAHRITDQTTLQVIEVEEEEAEWCLDILEEMFDHYYVRPEQAAARKAALDAKLRAAGKPPSKS